MNRKVILYRYERLNDDKFMTKVEMGEGMFHQFGVNYEEFDSGPGNYSTAIVEMPDGTVLNQPVEMIKFIS